MNVLLVGTEAVPFAKVGGMADVLGSLPIALRALSIDARVLLPGYGFMAHHTYDIDHLFTFEFTHRKGTSTVRVDTCVYREVPFYFVQAWPFFGEERSVYTTWEWDVPRFIFFAQMVMATLWELKHRTAWFPDVLHGNDWHTGLLPFLIAENRWQPIWANVATVCSIHNIAYQGEHAGGFLWDAGIPGRHHTALLAQGLTDNMLGIAIAYADMLSTVSPRYAREIQHPHAGYALAGLLRTRRHNLCGILNGLDTETWNPATDATLVSTYNAENMGTKRPPNKRHLQTVAHLPQRHEVPIIGMVSRLTQQKGIDIALPALRQLLHDTDVQVVLLGTGETALEEQCRYLAQDFPDKAAVFLEFDAALAQHIYAGIDLFLMPSHFEPCGIGQMMAMRYGALPLVRDTGGLADTVENFDHQEGAYGTGFVFQLAEPAAVLGTLRWALDTYHTKPQAWKRMQKRAMLQDLSWEKSARAYSTLYRKALGQKGAAS
jgi:starch synthase